MPPLHLAAPRALTRLAALVLLTLAVAVASAVALPGTTASATDATRFAAAMAETEVDLADRPRPGSRLPAEFWQRTGEQDEPEAPVAAAAPPPAPADPLCSGDGWQQRRGQAALESLRVGAERTGFTVRFSPGRSGYLGLAHLQERVVEIFVRSCSEQSFALLRHVVAHELGHAFDTTRMTDDRRAAWQAARGIPATTPWYGCSGCTDFATPAGDFAEVYAQWSTGATTNRSRVGGVPGASELAALATQFFGG